MVSPDLQEHSKAYLPLAATAASTIFIGLRLFVVAGYDQETASGILESTSTAAIIVGSLLSSVGYIVLISGLVCIAMFRVSPRDANGKSVSRGVFLCCGIGLIIAGILTTPVIVAGIALVAAIWAI